MNTVTEVAIVGAGPHGLSLSAQLSARGIEHRIFGRALDTWRRHMPKNMTLKSDGFASNLSAPPADSTLKAFCAKNGIVYGDQGIPVELETFLSYSAAFQQRFVPHLDEREVTHIARDGDWFTLTLEGGERVDAKNVVLAVGIRWFSYTPPVLANLPAEFASHSWAHREGDRFRNKEVVIIGRGASAVDLGFLLHETGASVRIVARDPEVEYNPVPDAQAETLFYRMLRPASGIGRGWKSLFCAQAPLLFYRLPEHLKARAIKSHMHPAAGWFMRSKVEGKIPMLLGRTLANAEVKKGRVELTVVDNAGKGETLVADHVIAATGYVTDMRRLPFLAASLRARVSGANGEPEVSDNFETVVPGLYTVGMSAMHAFGPLLRFMVGAEFVAPRLASHLAKKSQVSRSRAA